VLRVVARTLTVAAVASLALAVAVAAWAGGKQSVTVTAGKSKELGFTLSKKTLVKGQVVFTVTNKGVLEHDFKIAGKKTPLIKKGKTGKLTVTFAKAGRYPFVCTVKGHAAGGMKGTLTVR
jgi:uncharacterized cupredoxin-like copper-binding protein